MKTAAQRGGIRNTRRHGRYSVQNREIRALGRVLNHVAELAKAELAQPHGDQDAALPRRRCEGCSLEPPRAPMSLSREQSATRHARPARWENARRVTDTLCRHGERLTTRRPCSAPHSYQGNSLLINESRRV